MTRYLSSQSTLMSSLAIIFGTYPISFLTLEIFCVVSDFEQRRILVGVCPPAPVVTTQQVLAHVDATLKDFLVRHTFKVDAQRKAFDSNEILGSHIRLEAFQPGEILLLAQKLPELENRVQFDIKHALQCRALDGSKH